jgi:dCMP deaminase
VTRPTRDEVLVRQAQIVAERSTCSRAHVGTIIAREGRTLASGYNGAPMGMPHCDHTCVCDQDYPDYDHQLTDHQPTCPARPGCLYAVHAEANAVAFAARHGVATEGATLFTTMAPCLACSQLIINAGIVRVVFIKPYRDTAGPTLLADAGLGVEWWEERR